MTTSLLLTLPVLAFAKDVPPPQSTAPVAELTARVQALASRSTKVAATPPRFAFTSDLTVDTPASLDDATFGLPEIAIADKASTVIDAPDATTAVVSTTLGEFAYCAKPGCAGMTAQTSLRAMTVLDKIGDVWQPIAWAITPPIPGDSQVAAMAGKIVPEPIKRDVTGAEDVAKQFELALGDPKLFAAAIADKAEVVLYGSELAERYVTGKAVKAQVTGWGLGFKARDGVRAGVSASGALAWVAANVDGRFVKNPKMAPVPYRVFAVWERTGTAWKIVAIQFSTAV